MKILVIPVAAALALSGAPAWADDSETTVEHRVEQKTDGLSTQRSVETETETERDDDDRTTAVQREESVSAGPGGVEKRTEERVEHVDDD